jgi:hypothetical protein
MKSLALFLAIAATAFAAPPPPGVVIHHSPASSGQYIGSPSICILPNGDYLASHDIFGPSSEEHELATGSIYQSADRGLTWKHLTDLKGFFWTGLFVHDGALYAMGTDRHHGRLIIRRSTDNGKTWTDPTDSTHGLLAEGEWHTAPVPVIEGHGRLWRAVEDAMNGTKWGERYRARMASVPADADLLDARNWTISNPLTRDPAWLDGKFGAWLEGNAVAGPQGNIVDILRVDLPSVPEKAAIVSISTDGKNTTFDPATGFVDFPGGAKKFTIRKDPSGTGYWTIASIVLAPYGGSPGSNRNTLALVHSDDLKNWETRCILLHHPDVAKHGFQYVDWQFDGDDIIAACRTSSDDEEGGAHNYHDANFLTFHRWKKFRTLSRRDDVPLPDFTPVTYQASGLSITGTGFEIGNLRDDETAFSNRNYRWHDVPPELVGKRFTRLPGGGSAAFEIAASSDGTLRIATATSQPGTDLAGWLPEASKFHYDDSEKTEMQVFTRSINKGETMRIPQGNWTGRILIFDPIRDEP